MSELREMEWTAKWDWENIGAYASRAPKKMQLAADWVIVDDGDIHAGSFNLSGNSAHASSAKSSNDSGMRTTNYTIDASCANFSNTIEIKGASPPPDSSIASAEALLGLKLGKRTYFENSGGGGTVMPTPSTSTSTSTIIMKKTKSSSSSSAQNATPICCQVEGCNIDLSKAKEYHRKHRVCETHSKCPRVIVGGRDRRFCQQCSRFHSLAEFDEKKRSCRRRLSDHNARRRKPQQETIHFDPTAHSTPYYGGNQQMSFLLNNSGFVHSRTPGNCGWNSASKFTLTQGYSFKSNGDGGTDEQLHMPRIKPPQGILNMQNSPNRLFTSKNSTPVVSNPAAAAPEFGRALSLLSTNSWDSCEPESIPLHHQMHMQMHESDSSILQPPIVHAIPEGVPLSSSSSDFWPSHPHISTNANFQEIQLFKTPYDANFYSNVLN